ncbi:MAG: metallophosphoesterase [bacterium]
MKLGFFADTHDNLTMIRKAVDLFNRKEVDLVLHLGDFVSPFFLKALNNLKPILVAIFGNNDGDKLMLMKRFNEKGYDLFPPPYTLDLDKKKVLMLHEPFELNALSISGEYRIIAYAHTHIPEIKREQETLIINPGECGGWLYGKSTIACVDLETMKAEIIELSA